MVGTDLKPKHSPWTVSTVKKRTDTHTLNTDQVSDPCLAETRALTLEATTSLFCLIFSFVCPKNENMMQVSVYEATWMLTCNKGMYTENN